MHIFKLCRGLRFTTRDGRICTIDRQTITGQYHAIDESGLIESVTRRDLIDRWRRHEWVLDPTSIPYASDVIHHVTERDLATYKEDQQEAAKARLEMIQPFIERGQATKAELESHCMRLRETRGRAPAVRTMERWLTRYRRSRDITSLVPIQPCRGQIIQADFQNILEEAINEEFLVPERPSRLSVIESIQERVRKHNSTASESKQITCPSQATLYRLFTDIAPCQADKSRFGSDEARRRNRVAISVIKTKRVLERVELDHTHLDIILVDGNTGLVLGRPWLTVVIDHHSRMILGYHLTFNSPDAYSVLHALVQSVLPKTDLLARCKDLKNDWPALGLPQLIVVDNGMELHGARIQEFCLETGATLQFCPRVTPWFKPIVERFNRTLNSGLIHSLPGTTFGDVKTRGKYKSEEHACLDIEAFERVLLKWIVDDYHARPHRTIKMSPLSAWCRSTERCGVDLPASPAALQLLLGASTKRRLHHYGIEHDSVHYNSVELQAIYRSQLGYAGADAKHPAVTIRYYDTIDSIDVLDPETQTYLKVPARDMEYAKGLSRSTHQLLTQETRKKFGDSWRPSDRLAVKASTQREVEEARHRKSKNKRKLRAASNIAAVANADASGNALSIQQPLFAVNEAPISDESFLTFTPIIVPQLNHQAGANNHAR